jgi:hypothetical protein
MKEQIHIEESVDTLIKKLEGQGKKVKIIEDKDEDESQDDSDERQAI